MKVVHDELVELLGTSVSELDFSRKPTVIMMVGLQGSGKTTTSGKIAKLITKKYAKKPLLVAADIYRPAAVDQLKTLGQQLNVPVFEKGTDISAEDIELILLGSLKNDTDENEETISSDNSNEEIGNNIDFRKILEAVPGDVDNVEEYILKAIEFYKSSRQVGEVRVIH